MISCGVKSDRISARTLNIVNMRGFSEGKIRPQLIIGVVRVRCLIILFSTQIPFPLFYYQTNGMDLLHRKHLYNSY